MAWSSLLPNQMVTEEDMIQSGMPLKANQTHGSGNKCMTKLELLDRYNLDVEKLNNYSNSQLVQRQDIVSGVAIIYSYGISRGASTSSDACNLAVSSVVFMYSPSPHGIIIGEDICYTSASMDTVFVGNPTKWYKIDNGVDGGYAVQIDLDGVIINVPLARAF